MNPWWDRIWCLYDLETTHVEPESAHVVQIGLIEKACACD